MSGYAILADVAGNTYIPGQLAPIASQVAASSGNVANAVASATLPAVSGKTTYVNGFTITGSGALVGLPVIVTLSGVVGGPLSYVYNAAGAVLTGNVPLVQVFPQALAASAPNTSITISCPALGVGNTNNSAVITGFQL